MKGVNNKKLLISRLLLPLRRIVYRNDEWFDLVTPEGKNLGRAPRQICHRGPGLLHPVVHLHVTDKRGNLYLQKRSGEKKIQPGKWDTSVGGHADAGEEIETALIRETAEELGIEGFTPRFLTSYVWICPQESELVHVYTTLWEGDIKFDPAEIETGRFWSHEEISAALKTGVLTPNFEQEYGRLKDILFI